MSDISTLLGFAECGASGVRGYNTDKGCDTSFGILESIYVTDASVKLEGDFNKKMFTDLQKAGKLDVIKGILTSTEVGTDAIYETLASNQDLRAGDPVYRYDLVFNKGEYFNKALTYLAGTNKRVIMVDRNGNMRLANNSGHAQGFLVSLIDNNKMTLQTDTESAKQSLKLQFASSVEFTQRAEVIAYSNDMDFNPATFEDKTQAFVQLSAPAAGASFSFNLLVDRGRSQPVIGMTESDAFIVEIDGVEKKVSATNAGTDKVYTITETLTEGQKLRVRINLVQEDADGALYCSEYSSEVEVTA